MTQFFGKFSHFFLPGREIGAILMNVIMAGMTLGEPRNLPVRIDIDLF
jgi:hypothetical protein